MLSRDICFGLEGIKKARWVDQRAFFVSNEIQEGVFI